jgi:multiple sugar transport system substrate-binding protein
MTTTLRFVGRPFEGFERALDRQMDAFAETRDVEFERDHQPLPEIHEELVAGGGLDDGTYDLFLCLSDWLPAVAEQGLLEPLDNRIEADPPADWPEGWAESMRELVTWDGTTYGVPYHDGPEIFHYREDLFESAEEQRRFREDHGKPLHVPRTWDEFLEVADFFTRPEEGLWGTVVAAKPDGHNDVYDWLIHFWSRGGEVFDDDGNVAFDSEAGVKALQFYHDLLHDHGVAPPASLEMESVESGEFYAEGNAAMMWNWSGFGALSEGADSAVFGQTNYGIIPRADTPEGRHTSLTVLYGLTVPASSENADLAYEFLRHASTAEMDKVTTVEGASGTRLSTWRDPEILRTNTFYSMVEEINTSNVRFLPRIPQFTELNDILNEMVRSAVVDRERSPEEAVERAAAQTRDLLE